ncbi:MAG: VOC family protein [Clostridia bacterium]
MNRLLTIMLCVALLLSLACPTVAFAQDAPAPAPKVEGISRISVSVFDLEKSVAFYADTMELTEAARGELSQEACKALYGMDCAAQYVMMKNPVQTTLLQLIKFEKTPEKTSREGYNSWDLGYYDVSFRCADIQKVRDDMVANGATFLCEPYQYTTTWSGATVFEAVTSDPNGVPLAIINKTEKTPAFEGMFRNFPDVVLVVGDMAEADAFYEGVLGCPKAFDMEMEKGLVDPIVGVAGTEYNTRIAMYMGAGATPVIEVLDFDAEGKSMTEAGASVPANAGLFATCFLVEGLDDVLKTASDAGFATVAAPVEMAVAPYGAIRTAMVAGPNGSTFELFEVL